MRKLFPVVLILIMMFMFVGCGQKGPTKTPEGHELGDMFDEAYTTLATSKALYTQALRMSADMYEKDVINDDEKSTIIEFATKYKEIHNNTQLALDVWHSTVDEGGDVDRSTKEKVLEGLYRLSQNSDQLVILVEQYGDVEIPNELIPQLGENIKAWVDMYNIDKEGSSDESSISNTNTEIVKYGD